MGAIPVVIPVRQSDNIKDGNELDRKMKMHPAIWQKLHRIKLFFLPIRSAKYPVNTVPSILVG